MGLLKSKDYNINNSTELTLELCEFVEIHGARSTEASCEQLNFVTQPTEAQIIDCMTRERL